MGRGGSGGLGTSNFDLSIAASGDLGVEGSECGFVLCSSPSLDIWGIFDAGSVVPSSTNPPFHAELSRISLRVLRCDLLVHNEVIHFLVVGLWLLFASRKDG